MVIYESLFPLALKEKKEKEEEKLRGRERKKEKERFLYSLLSHEGIHFIREFLAMLQCQSEV